MELVIYLNHPPYIHAQFDSVRRGKLCEVNKSQMGEEGWKIFSLAHTHKTASPAYFRTFDIFFALFLSAVTQSYI